MPLSSQTARPAPTRTDGSNAFARHSMAVRVPSLIDETAERNPDYPRAVTDELVRLRDDITGDAPVPPLALPAPDADEWADALAAHAGDTWLQTDWFFAELYAYRLVNQAVRYWGTFRDPFAPFKDEEMRSDALWTTLEAALAADVPLDEHLRTDLTAALWGNRIDLSLKTSAALGTDAHDDHLLADDVPAAVAHLLDADPGTVHFVMDNAGTEQALDLVLADRLLTAGVAASVTLHVKMQPVLVSDVIVPDVHDLIARMSRRVGAVAGLAARLSAHLDAGRLRVVPDPFWTGPRWMWQLPDRLRQPLEGARLVVFKGDANYRRLTDDAVWPPGHSFADAMAGFPAPALALRTLKCDALVGLPPDLVDRMDAEAEPDWRTRGVYGVAQFSAG